MKDFNDQLMDYNYWANGLILKYTEKLSKDQYLKSISPFQYSLRDILCHTMFAETLWLNRMQGQTMSRDQQREFFQNENYTNLNTLYEDWFDLELRMRAFLGEMNDERLREAFSYSRSNGETHNHRFVDVFTQLVFHGMQHRSECAVILTEFGHSPGNIDYIVYLRP